MRFHELLARLNEEMDDVETTCREMVECAEHDRDAYFIGNEVHGLLAMAQEFCNALADVGRDYTHFVDEGAEEERLRWKEYYREEQMYG